MSRTYHKPHPHASTDAAGLAGAAPAALKRYGSRLVTDVTRVLDDYPWLYYVGFGSLGGLWGVGGWLIMSVGARSAMIAGGVLLILGGFVEIVLSRALAHARDNCPWWLRWWEEGYWSSMIDYGPGAYRFFGSAVAGAGLGCVSYALLANNTAAVVVGIVACLGLWVWTWFAFSEMED